MKLLNKVRESGSRKVRESGSPGVCRKKLVLSIAAPSDFRTFVLPVFFSFVLLLCSSILLAQTTIVKAYTDKNKILLGEPFWLTLEVKLPQSGVVAPFKVDSIPHFEFITKDSTSTQKIGDTTVIRQYFQLTSFDSGRWVIPPFRLRPYVKTNSLLMDVVFTENFDPKQPYHDIQDVRKVPFKLNKKVEDWWYFIAALLILLTLVIYWLTGEKKPKPERNKVYEGAYEKAMRQLGDLKGSHVDAKVFCSQLAEIFRTYIFEKTGIMSMQQTSSDLLEKLKAPFKDRRRHDGISQVLMLCDFVKFAKYQPDKNESVSAFEVVKDAIDYIEQDVNKLKS